MKLTDADLEKARRILHEIPEYWDHEGQVVGIAQALFMEREAERSRCHAIAEKERDGWPPGYLREACENIADAIEESDKWADEFTDQARRDAYVARYEARIRADEREAMRESCLREVLRETDNWDGETERPLRVVAERIRRLP